MLLHMPPIVKHTSLSSHTARRKRNTAIAASVSSVVVFIAILVFLLLLVRKNSAAEVAPNVTVLLKVGEGGEVDAAIANSDGEVDEDYAYAPADGGKGVGGGSEVEGRTQRPAPVGAPSSGAGSVDDGGPVRSEATVSGDDSLSETSS